MLRTMLKSKIHRATVTEANIDYEGSITIDRELLEAANILPYEEVRIYNVTNGERFETYAIEGAAGGGEICLNGAAAHKVSSGDIVIIACFGMVSEEQARGWKPDNVYVDGANRIALQRSGVRAA